MSLHPPPPVWHSGWRLLGLLSALLFGIAGAVLVVAARTKKVSAYWFG